MTGAQLADLFTPPNDTLRRVRARLIQNIDHQILAINIAYLSEINLDKRLALAIRRNILVIEAAFIRELIDHEGKVLKSDLEGI